MRIGFIDCSSGISGDMLLGALVDAGLSLTVLKNELAKLPIRDRFKVMMSQTKRGAIYGTRIESACDESLDHRHLSDITGIILDSSLEEPIKENAVKIFACLAEAEAVVHGTSVEKVHLHEVGALDSIIDVTGCAIALQILGIEEIYTTPVNLGGGTVKCSHGVIPVPVPAVAELLKNYPTQASENLEGELCTPTGAALIKVLSSGVKTDIPMLIRATGYGAGSRTFDGVSCFLSVTIGDV
jgi:hypothetical protein